MELWHVVIEALTGKGTMERLIEPFAARKHMLVFFCANISRPIKRQPTLFTDGSKVNVFVGESEAPRGWFSAKTSIHATDFIEIFNWSNYFDDPDFILDPFVACEKSGPPW